MVMYLLCSLATLALIASAPAGEERESDAVDTVEERSRGDSPLTEQDRGRVDSDAVQVEADADAQAVDAPSSLSDESARSSFELPAPPPNASDASAASDVPAGRTPPESQTTAESRESLATEMEPMLLPDEIERGKAPLEGVQPVDSAWSGSLRIVSGVDLGTLPSVAPLLELTLGAHWRWLRVDAGFAQRFARRIDLRDGAHVDISTRVAIVQACGVPSVSLLEFPICVGMELGAIRGASRGVEGARASRGFVATGRALAGMHIRVNPRVWVALEAAAAVPTVRTGFRVEGRGEVHRMHAVSGQFTGGVVFRFP